MSQLKPKISNQLNIEVINDACDKNYQAVMLKYYQLQFGWFHNAYNSFQDIDKYIILAHLVNKTLSTYNKHFYNLTFDQFYSNKSVEIEKISISELVRELNITKETARRKLNEMTRDKIIVRNKKKITIQQNAFTFQKPIVSIKNFSNFLSTATEHLTLRNSQKSFSAQYFEEKIKENYTHYWNDFLNFQIGFVLKFKQLYLLYLILYKYKRMTKTEKVNFVIKTLNNLYPKIPIPLDHKDPYTLLIAVLLSAQCTDVRVNQITPILFAKADNPFDMIKMSVEEIKAIIRPCGLSPMKSKGIHGLSHIIIEKHQGKVPKSFEALEALPAVGHKTASVVMSQAFGVPTFPVDTHIHRLMYRWNLSNGKSVVQTERDAKRLFPKELWNNLHLQIIWYGREYSPARGWNLEKDIISRKIGRKSVLKSLERTHKKS